MPEMTFTEDEMKGNNYLGEGDHLVTLTEVATQQSSNDNLMYVLHLKSGARERKEYVTYTDKTRWKLGGILAAFGVKPGQSIDFPQDVLGKRCMVTVAKTGVFENKEGRMVDKHEVVAWSPSLEEDDDSGEEIPF